MWCLHVHRLADATRIIANRDGRAVTLDGMRPHPVLGGQKRYVMMKACPEGQG
jgi:hypothetical protein